jgi:hypothetical protein
VGTLYSKPYKYNGEAVLVVVIMVVVLMIMMEKDCYICDPHRNLTINPLKYI